MNTENETGAFFICVHPCSSVVNSPRAWRVVGASVRGVSHLRSGRPCQDAHSWRRVGAFLVAAVADGAGSAPLAEVGSCAAAHAAVETAAGRLQEAIPTDYAGWKVLLGGVLETARQAVEAEAARCQCPPADLATTLLIAIAGDDILSACQVGDGAIIARLPDESLLAATRPLPGEYINETTFLTSNNYLAATQFATLRQRINGMILLSDGLQMLALKMPDGTPHLGFFAPLLQFAALADPGRAQDQLQGFLQSPRIIRRADDDLTLLLAVR
jgi:hypothetical protein